MYKGLRTKAPQKEGKNVLGTPLKNENIASYLTATQHKNLFPEYDHSFCTGPYVPLPIPKQHQSNAPQ